MANHKRKRPKNRRAGCLLCKPWKMNGYSRSSAEGEQFGAHKRRTFAANDLSEHLRRDPRAALIAAKG